MINGLKSKTNIKIEHLTYVLKLKIIFYQFTDTLYFIFVCFVSLLFWGFKFIVLSMKGRHNKLRFQHKSFFFYQNIRFDFGIYFDITI